MFRCLIVCLLFFSLILNSQTIVLKIVPTSKNSIVSKFNYQKKFSTKTLALKELSNLITILHYKGYLLASIDTIIVDSTTLTAKISENNFYKWAYLRLGNLNPTLASKIGISEKLYFNKAFKYKDVAKSFAVFKNTIYYF